MCTINEVRAAEEKMKTIMDALKRPTQGTQITSALN